MATIDYAKRFQDAEKRLKDARKRSEYATIRDKFMRHRDGVFVKTAYDIPYHLCICCGKPTAQRYNQRITEVNWEMFNLKSLLIFICCPYAILFSIAKNRRTGTEFEYGLCHTHQRQSRIKSWKIALCCLLAYPIFGVAVTHLYPSLGTLTLLAWPIICHIGLKKNRTLSGYPTRMGFVLQGIGEEFLNYLDRKSGIQPSSKTSRSFALETRK